MREHGRFFQTDNKSYWRGSPDVERGETLRAQFERRAQSGRPAAVVHLGEVGRRGSIWGSLFLEVNGASYHFSADVRRLAPHIADGILDEAGKCLIARGTGGVLECDVPWKWIQESVDVSALLAEPALDRLKDGLERMSMHQDELPRYQSFIHALDRGVEPDLTMHNCATFVAWQLGLRVSFEIARMPVPLFDHIVHLAS